MVKQPGHSSTIKGIMSMIRVNSKTIIFLVLVFLSLLYHFSSSGSDTKLAQFKRVTKSDKLNSDGQYVPFYGYTIISMATVGYDDSLIEQFLRNTRTLSKYLAPLPASSYHVTIFDIFTQRNVPVKYASVSGNVPSHHWTNALRYLLNDLDEAKKICSKLTSKLFFRKTRFNIGKTGLSVAGHLTSENFISDLRNQFLSLFPNTARQTMSYHITLGYWFKEIDNEDIESINNEFKKLWMLINDEYPLQAPDVYYFESMTKFISVPDFASQ